MADDAWGLAEAKAKLSEVIERARTQGPQTITKNGRPAGVLVSPEEWARHAKPAEKPKMTLYEFFEQSPLRGSGLVLERDRSPGRDVTFD